MKSYRLVLFDRFQRKTEASFAAAQAEITAASLEHEAAANAWRGVHQFVAEHKARLDNKAEEVRELEQQAVSEDDADRAVVIRRRVVEARRELSGFAGNFGKAQKSARDGDQAMEATASKLELAERAFFELRKRTPEADPTFVAAEVGIDLVRFSLPFLVSSYAVGTLVVALATANRF